MEQESDDEWRTLAMQNRAAGLTERQKLEKVKPFTSHAAADRLPPSFPSAVAKRRIIETERENSRIFVKMKSVSSNLSRDRMGS